MDARTQRTSTLGLASGTGLVVANMVGTGVFLSTGFMAQSLSPAVIMLAWATGAAAALLGAYAYGQVARVVPSGGGEYRYLSTLIHPAAGFLAGAGSLLMGFSAPLAVDALALGAFAHQLVPALAARPTAAVVLVLLTAVHAAGFHPARRAQDTLVAVKLLLLLGFVGAGLWFGRHQFPSWEPPHPAASVPSEFAGSLFYIAFAFSGWNAATYYASEFSHPQRDVPRAMLLGCAGVSVLYLVVNWIFLVNLTPAETSAVFGYQDFALAQDSLQQTTLGQVMMTSLLGPGAGSLMGLAMVLILASSMSAMMMAGPRVYAAMALDGYLPTALAPRDNHPPAAAVLLQGAIALAMVFTHDIRAALSNAGAVLVFFSALTVAGLFRVRTEGPRPLARHAAALAYVAFSLWLFWMGAARQPELLAWAAAVGVLTWGLWHALRGRLAATAPWRSPRTPL